MLKNNLNVVLLKHIQASAELLSETTVQLFNSVHLITIPGPVYVRPVSNVRLMKIRMGNVVLMWS